MYGLRAFKGGGSGPRSLASFAELYRHSVSNAPVRPGDPLVGNVVGQRRGRSGSKQRFYVVDFGMKTEAPFASREIPGASNIGSRVALPIIELEDAFNEPSLDYERRTALPALQAERISLLTRMAPNRAHMLHGRFAVFKRGGASVKALGTDAFVPRHHVVSIERPLLGSYAPFYVLSLTASARGKGPTSSVEVSPVLSSYGGYLFMLANLVGFDEQWKASGGGSARERLAYLRLLTRLLYVKNTSVRRIMPRHNDADARSYVGKGESGSGRQRFPLRGPRQTKEQQGRQGAWLDNMQADARPPSRKKSLGGHSRPLREQRVQLVKGSPTSETPAE